MSRFYGKLTAGDKNPRTILGSAKEPVVASAQGQWVGVRVICRDSNGRDDLIVEMHGGGRTLFHKELFTVHDGRGGWTIEPTEYLLSVLKRVGYELVKEKN